MLHGSECLESIRATAASLFGGSKGADGLESLAKIPLATSMSEGEGVTVVDLLVRFVRKYYL